MFGRKKRIEALEAKVAELEAKLAPTVSKMTSGEDKPLTMEQIVDKWLNGKDGDGK